MKRHDGLAIDEKSVTVLVDELAYRAKLNKPSNQWKTSEWDSVVDQVALAMKRKP
ncbi:MAG: hypothetical protein H0U63_04595 [Burkholderiales bacterium]|nr:hypothetical protein [Burkholderiales bacterium]